MTTRQARETRKIELVETANIALCLRRLKDAPGCDDRRWKRALLHAIQMSYAETGWDDLTKIREALKLP